MKHLYIKTFWFFWILAFVLAPVSLFMMLQGYARGPGSSPGGGIMLILLVLPFFFLIHLALLVPTFIAAKRGNGLVTHKGFKAITCSVCIGISLIGSLPVIATSLPLIATGTWADCSKSAGEWKNCKEHGQGTQYEKKGNVFGKALEGVTKKGYYAHIGGRTCWMPRTLKKS